MRQVLNARSKTQAFRPSPPAPGLFVLCVFKSPPLTGLTDIHLFNTIIHPHFPHEL